MHPRLLALAALRLRDPAAKIEATHRAAAALGVGVPLRTLREPGDEAGVPGRPERPIVLSPMDVPRRSPFTPEGRAALLHSICHIEFNAINLALDAAWRFDGMPERFHEDWLKVAAEEAHHFALLDAHLRGMGWRYGDFPAHHGLWAMCERTAGDIVARMALVPRTLEARGLDATPQIQAKLRRVGTPDALAACDILELILRDEVGHVAIGNHWYRWLCERDGLDPVSHYRVLARRHEAPRPRAPFNIAARARAGFRTRRSPNWICRWGRSCRRRPHGLRPSSRLPARSTNADPDRPASAQPALRLSTTILGEKSCTTSPC
ncbi:MAG: ferritin-like domain-containing protein [Comamonadaceae bacterium]|nr:MAG: ferritin-like domain-containing protein [Comamonadaceae bacterium]